MPRAACTNFTRLFERVPDVVFRPAGRVHQGLGSVLGTLAGNEQALSMVKGMARWADHWTAGRSEAHMQNPLALRRDELRGLHANTHIPQVTGAARRYELTGDNRFRDVAEFVTSEIYSARSYATWEPATTKDGWCRQES